MNKICVIFTTFLVALLTSCYDSRFENPTDRPDPQTTFTIARLHERFDGVPTVVKDDISVCGVVTSSDKERNFYRTLLIEDEGFAVEVMAGTDHLHNDYPTGCRVLLHLRDLAIGRQRGVLQVGARPLAGSHRPTDYFPSQVVLHQHLIRLDTPPVHPEPFACRIADLNPSLCGRLVRIDRLRLTDSTATWTGTHCFRDSQDLEIETYVRPYARFADSPIPTGICSLTGILQLDKGTYTLKLRSEDDCRF